MTSINNKPSSPQDISIRVQEENVAKTTKKKQTRNRCMSIANCSSMLSEQAQTKLVFDSIIGVFSVAAVAGEIFFIYGSVQSEGQSPGAIIGAVALPLLFGAVITAIACARKSLFESTRQVSN